MKHESIVVVYDSCQAIAEEIADKLGSETVSVQSVNSRQIESCRSFVLAVEFQKNGELTPHWQWGCQTLTQTNLSGKNIAVLVALGSSASHETNKLCSQLRENQAHIIGIRFQDNTPQYSLDNWISSISPNL